jgi:hypothetical protein
MSRSSNVFALPLKASQDAVVCERIARRGFEPRLMVPKTIVRPSHSQAKVSHQISMGHGHACCHVLKARARGFEPRPSVLEADCSPRSTLVVVVEATSPFEASSFTEPRPHPAHRTNQSLCRRSSDLFRSLNDVSVCELCRASDGKTSPRGFEPLISTLTGWRALRTAPRGQ